MLSAAAQAGGAGTRFRDGIGCDTRDNASAVFGFRFSVFGPRAVSWILAFYLASPVAHLTVQPMIEVRDLRKSYADLRRGEFVAVDRVSFSAKPGEIYGLLGPNGAGKTTILRVLSTAIRPTSGTAVVAGYDVVTQPALVRHNIGFVSTNTAVYDRMTAWEMVEYFGRLYGLTAELLRERMEAIFARLGMNEIRDVLGAKMSTGMKQKVSIARALVHEPPVLIFDEATVGLDVLVARALLKTIAALRDQGKCVVLSTHIMREAERLCDRVAILHRGHVLAEGSLGELRERSGEEDLEELFFKLISEREEIQNSEFRIQNSPASPISAF
jgi:sodium transport system ATP-binding protein